MVTITIRRFLRRGKRPRPCSPASQLLEELPEELTDVSIDIYFESVQAEGTGDAREAFERIAG